MTPADASAPKRKVLLIGWDAADWQVIDQLIAEGEMPALARFLDRGVRGNLATMDPPLSPILWTTIATGHTPDRHGILNFIEPNEAGDGLQPVHGTSRRVKALWNIFSQEDLRSIVVNWWPSHPAEPVKGAMVSNFFAKANGKSFEMSEGAVYPQRVAGSVQKLRIHPREITGAMLQPFLPRGAEIDLERDQRPGSLAGILASNASVHAAATWLLEHEAWDFAAVYYDAIDHVGHGFMKYHPPRMPHIAREDFEMYRDVVRGMYRFHDMMLERLLELAGDDATVILMSDHGFHSGHRRPAELPKNPVGPAAEHREFGIFAMAGPGVRRSEKIFGARILDVAPTVLSLFGLPVGRDMAGRPLTDALESAAAVTYIDSWENVEGPAGSKLPAPKRDAWAEREALDQLVALGYIDAPDGDVQKQLAVSKKEAELNLARSFLSLGRAAEALPVLEQIYASFPEDQRVSLRLAFCYRQLGRLKEAQACLDAFQQRSKAVPPVVHLMKGMVALDEQRPEASLRHLQSLAEQAPHQPVLHSRMGEAFLRLDRWHDAESAFRRALTIDPDFAAAFQGLGVALTHQDRLEEAVEALLHAVDRQYFFPSAHYFIGECLMRIGEFANAANAFELALRQAPGMRKAHLHLERLYMWHLNEPGKAVHHQQRAEQIVQTRAA